MDGSPAPDADPRTGETDLDVGEADPHTGDTEEVDALIVSAEPSASVEGDRALPERARPRALAELRNAPAVQAAAVAAGGFVAGAAVVGLARRRRTVDRAARRGRGKERRGKGGERLQIVGSRSLLVDVHLLGR